LSKVEPFRLVYSQDKSFLIIVCSYIIFIVFIYIGLHGKYRIENVDDAWTVSWAYNIVIKHTEIDDIFPFTKWRLSQFHKTYAYLYGYILKAIGWTKSNAHIISIIISFLSLICWYNLLLSLDYDKKFAISFILILCVSEPFFALANQARVDALTFLFVSFSFYSLITKRYFIFGLSTLIAIENHPIGVISIFYAAPFFLLNYKQILESPKEKNQFLMKLAAGIIIGMLYYIYLHWDGLNKVPATLIEGSSWEGSVNNFLFAYFLKTKYLRHLPELIIFLASALIFIFSKYYKKEKLVPFILISLLFSTLVIRRPNFHYTIFVYPGFILTLVFVAHRLKKINLALVLFLVLLFPQYSFVRYVNRHYNETQYIQVIKGAVPAEEMPIIGSPNDWFAFYDRPFYTYERYKEGLDLTKFYFIEKSNYFGLDSLEQISNYEKKLINRINFNNVNIKIWQISELRNHDSSFIRN